MIDIAGQAGADAAIVSDAPNVVAFYLGRLSRPDIKVRALSADGVPCGPGSWLIVQREHLTFENREAVARVQRDMRPWREYYAGDVLAAQVYRISGSR